LTSNSLNYPHSPTQSSSYCKTQTLPSCTQKKNIPYFKNSLCPFVPTSNQELLNNAAIIQYTQPFQAMATIRRITELPTDQISSIIYFLHDYASNLPTHADAIDTIIHIYDTISFELQYDILISLSMHYEQFPHTVIDAYKMFLETSKTTLSELFHPSQIPTLNMLSAEHYRPYSGTYIIPLIDRAYYLEKRIHWLSAQIQQADHIKDTIDSA